ncbi:MAG: hypothetical protein P3T54_05910 [Dehalogenimonas sp.]|uniref:Uncharacterized protein n=1 Tax=Candidatus Dehalogenimonas loeffleri TaxID=3127115 RepID=A0ABZ2J4K7_9CHLR|nr:hypothetical protein [Dehalogenimonas sp.]
MPGAAADTEDFPCRTHHHRYIIIQCGDERDVNTKNKILIKIRKIIEMYLLTGLIYPDNPKFLDEEGVLKGIENLNLESIGVFLSNVEIETIPRKTGYMGGNRRFAFSLSNGDNDAVAQCFADAMMFALAVMYDIGIDNPPVPLRINKDNVKIGEIIQRQDIVNCKNNYEKNELLYHEAIGVPHIILSRVFQAIPIFFLNPPMMNSGSFYRESILKIWLCEDDVSELSLDGDTPTSVVEKTNIETAYQNAYKAIEAIIGEPSSDKDKFRNKLKAQGINPDEIIGYDALRGIREETIFNKILNMQETRDTKAAHGKTGRPRDIGYLELADKQKLAKYIILRTVSHLSQ